MCFPIFASPPPLIIILCSGSFYERILTGLITLPLSTRQIREYARVSSISFIFQRRKSLGSFYLCYPCCCAFIASLQLFSPFAPSGSSRTDGNHSVMPIYIVVPLAAFVLFLMSIKNARPRTVLSQPASPSILSPNFSLPASVLAFPKSSCSQRTP